MNRLILRKVLNKEFVTIVFAFLATICLYFILSDHLYKEPLPLVGLIFTVFVTVHQWYESKKEKEQLELKEVKKEFYVEIKSLKDRFDRQDRKSDSQDNLINNKLDNLSNNFDNHVSSVGHDYTIKEFLRLEKELLYLQVLVSMQTKYAELIKYIQKIK